MIAPGTDVDNDPRLATLSCLYGLEVVPPDLVAFFTGDASKLQKVLLPGEDRVEALGRAFALLHKHFMVIEEKPILTRFLLFTRCAWTLLMMKVLGLTQEAFQLMATKPREKDAKRATGFWKFMTAHSTDMQLRICSLCLVLTQHATNISAKIG